MGDNKSCSRMEGKERYRKLYNKFNHNEIVLNLCYKIKTYKNYYCKTTQFISLTFLTETSMNVEQYGEHSEVLIPLTAVVYKCQTDTDNTDGKGYGHPQAVAKRCDVTVPCYVGVVG